MKVLVVNDKFDNKKILSFLEHEFPDISRSIFYKALRKKDIRINDIKISENSCIHAGDNIKIYIPDEKLLPAKPILDIAYEDDNILVLNKPKGIEVTREKFFRRTIKKGIWCYALS